MSYPYVEKENLMCGDTILKSNDKQFLLQCFHTMCHEAQQYDISFIRVSDNFHENTDIYTLRIRPDMWSLNFSSSLHLLKEEW